MSDFRTDKPLVTVIMPAHDSVRYIGEAVASVRSQSYTNWELIIVDDASIDGTLNAAKSAAEDDPRITVLRLDENLGAAASRNFALEQAMGDYIAFIDSDDAWLPQKLETQLAAIDSTSSDLCYTSYAIVDEDGHKTKRDYIVPEHIDFEGLLCENVIDCSTVLVKASLLGKDAFSSIYAHEDYVLWLSLLSSGVKVVGCTEVLANWRFHQGSRSYDKLKSAAGRWTIYRKALGLSFGKSIVCMKEYALAGYRKYYGGGK